jgi:hypothetical protein
MPDRFLSLASSGFSQFASYDKDPTTQDNIGGVKTSQPSAHTTSRPANCLLKLNTLSA